MRPILLALLAITNSPAQYVSNPRIDYATHLGAIRVTPSIAVDSAGYAYVVGATGGGCDIAKINPSGTHVTCISVPSAPFPNALAMDRSGALFVAGSQTIVKLSRDGRQVLYSTTITGASAKAIAVDSAGNAYIAGTADATFVTTPGAYQAHLPTGTTSAA